MLLLTILELQKDLGWAKKYTQVYLTQGDQSYLWYHGKGLEAMKDTALFLCSLPAPRL